MDVFFYRQEVDIMKGLLKAALIGAGMIANEGHIPAYREIPDDVDLAAVCDTNAEAVAKCARRHDIRHFYENAEEMLETEKPDLVSITTPNLTHPALVRTALEHGANVLCEKPLTLDYREAKALYALAEEKGLKLVACQTQRFCPAYFAARDYIRRGLLGEPYYGEITRVRRRGVPAWGHFLQKEINGGGALADIGVHVIDAQLWLMGNPRVTEVSGFSSSAIIDHETGIRYDLNESGSFAAPPGSVVTIDRTGCDVEEFASGMIRTESAGINFKIAWAANLPNQTRLTVLGDRMGLEVPDLKVYGTLGQDQTDLSPRLFPLGPYDTRPFSGHYYLIRNVVNALLGREELLIHPEETLNTLAVIDLFYRSLEKGTTARRDEIEE